MILRSNEVRVRLVFVYDTYVRIICLSMVSLKPLVLLCTKYQYLAPIFNNELVRYSERVFELTRVYQSVLGAEAHFGFGRLSANRPKNVFGYSAI